MTYSRYVKRFFARGRDEHGGISVFVALGITVFLGMAALAIDMGHMMNARTESQRVADLAALAAAGAFIDAPLSPDATARDWAVDFASRNTVNRTAVTLDRDADIDVNLAQEEVRVTVFHTQARGNPIPTIFARVLGFNSVDIVTTAVAKAWPSSGVTCILPLFLVDKWDELGGDPLYYDPGIDYYEPYSTTSTTYTGYDEGDVGTEIIIKPAQGPNQVSGQPNQSWYYPFDAEDIPGGANYRDAITQCGDPTFVYTYNQLLWVENGAMIGPTAQGFRDLIALDPNAIFDPTQGCVVDVPGGACRASPRLRPVPMMSPVDTPASGKKQVPITNFGGVFVDRVQGNNVYVIFAGYSGVEPSGGGPQGGSTPPLLKTVRLIE
ncbi:MAG: pilus assembly protein TadG-related protein [Gemmatimonadota bacterium]